MREVWKPVADDLYGQFYEVSNMGRVRSLDKTIEQLSNAGKKITKFYKGRILKTFCSQMNYPTVTLQHKRQTKRINVHRLVLLTFVGPPPEGLCVNHKNGNPIDNRLENLEYVTSKQNSQHAAKILNSMARGEHHGLSKLTEGNVLKIRNLYETGKYNQHQLASIFNVDQRNIWQIIHRITWTHI